jgi:SET domain-containing protein
MNPAVINPLLLPNMPKSKKQLFDHLRHGVYCHLGVSKVHGIGVFAIRPIPKGIEPLRSLVKFDDVKFTHEEIKTLAPGVRREIEMFCYYDDKHVHVPRIGLNAANMSVYLNHSKTPNVEFKKNGQLVSLRAIKKGEELLMDYDINFDAVHIFD